MRREDGGRGFLRAMRAAERTDAKQSLYRSVVSSNKFPVQIIWTRDDPALPLATYGRQAREVAGVEPIVIPGKHFPQEDQSSELARHISRFVSREPAHGLTAPASGGHANERMHVGSPTTSTVYSAGADSP